MTHSHKMMFSDSISDGATIDDLKSLLDQARFIFNRGTDYTYGLHSNYIEVELRLELLIPSEIAKNKALWVGPYDKKSKTVDTEIIDWLAML